MSLLDRAKLTGDAPAPEPAELEQPGEVIELDRDPEPGRRARRAGRRQAAAASNPAPRKQARAGGKFTSRDQIQKGIADEIEMYSRMLALTWSMTDPECATVLSDSSAKIATELAALCARSEWIVEHFQTTSLFGDIAKLLHALLPLGRAVFAHHIAGRRGEEDPGEVDRVTVATEYGAAPAGVQYAPFRPAYSA